MSCIVEYRKLLIEAYAIGAAVESFAQVSKMLSVTPPHVTVQYPDEMNAANTNQWLGNGGTTNESFCTANEGSFASGELAYDEAQSAMDCIAPSKV